MAERVKIGPSNVKSPTFSTNKIVSLKGDKFKGNNVFKYTLEDMEKENIMKNQTDFKVQKQTCKNCI